MKRHSRIAGVFLIIVGVLIMVDSYFELKLGNFRHPDSGFLPFWYGLGLVVLSMVLVLTHLGADKEPLPFWSKGQWVRPLMAVIIVLIYSLILESLGYVLSTFLFLLSWEAIIEREKWGKTLSICVLGTLAMYVIFERLLGVPLPTGILGL
ncbi:MAG: tripartite tricarboxylate transporter TctB family protein [Moorellaceae bacterium]